MKLNKEWSHNYVSTTGWMVTSYINDEWIVQHHTDGMPDEDCFMVIIKQAERPTCSCNPHNHQYIDDIPCCKHVMMALNAKKNCDKYDK